MRIGWVFSFRDEFLAKSWHLEHIWDVGADIVREVSWASRHVEDSDQMYGCWWNMASRQKVTAYSVSTLPLAGRNSANMCSERGPVGFLEEKKKVWIIRYYVNTSGKDKQTWYRAVVLNWWVASQKWVGAIFIGFVGNFPFFLKKRDVIIYLKCWAFSFAGDTI